MSAITITFGDQAENHVGMEKLGSLRSKGFNLENLKIIGSFFSDTEIINLKEAGHIDNIVDDDAYILIIKDGVSQLFESNKTILALTDELISIEWDKKAKMYGRVVNKHARHNLCFSEEGHLPNYDEGKGRVVAWRDVPLLYEVKTKLLDILKKSDIDDIQLVAEGNHYYNIKKCGIGFHGDLERKIVIAIRLGSPFPLHYHWYFNNKRIGQRIEFFLGNGDIYIMSEKATGNDSRLRKIPVLRHAAGCEKYTA